MDYFTTDQSVRSSTHGLIGPNSPVPPGAIAPDMIEAFVKAGVLVGYERMVAPVEAPPAPPAPKAEPVSASDWAYDPATLEGKPLEVLNMMIAEHTARHGMAPVEPMETIEEAFHWLTQSWKAPGGAGS